ncbi:hypothetical protein F53441_12681 [Fusarium austroafricanum]|uniref:Zn(2)-C6 fungal-type domain-containing protein n=1 Tax=Fusarium austroafricanum TaxID=2364996 RepID=A0A8H4NUT5_9HYPO|nr:hypothetical protein F53441_12681 [Fusarium austroafricanum]
MSPLFIYLHSAPRMEEPMSKNIISRRKRASKACMGCRSRKVRCDVVYKPHQCTNCALDNAQCVVKDRRTSYRKRSPTVVEKQKRIRFREGLPQLQPKHASLTELNPTSPHEPFLEPEFSDIPLEESLGSPSACFQELWDGSSMDYTLNGPVQAQLEDVDEGSDAIGRAIDHHKATDSSDTTASPKNHEAEPVLPSKAKSHSEAKLISQSHILYSYYQFLDLDISGLSPDDVHYLEAQGCFRVPTREALDEFVREYFLHVHPGLPLLDEALFWDTYIRPRQSCCKSSLSLFVFQAMLFASCSFLPFSTLQSLGFTSVRSARDTYYRRAKLLYDLCGERSLVPSSQGALLLSYNGTMKDQKRINSIWLATAIHLALAAGADQFHTSSDRNSRATNELKRLWWCCIVRDRILPLGVRRQLHIMSLDLAQENYLLTEQDFAHEIKESRVYSPKTKRTLVQLFITLCELAVPLTDVIKAVYSTGPSIDVNSPMFRDFQQTNKSLHSCEARLDAWFDRATTQFPTPAGITSDEESLVLYTNLMYIYYYSARFALYQHEAFVISLGLVGSDLDNKLGETRCQLEDASLRITEHLKELIQLKLGRFLPISITALNYTTTEGYSSQPCAQLSRIMDFGERPSLKSPLISKDSNNWGNILIKEPVLYFRLSRAIDLSLALGRYSEDSALGLSPTPIHFPSPRLLRIDMAQDIQANTPEHDEAPPDMGRASEAGDELLITPQVLEDIDEFVIYNFGVDDLEIPISFNETELEV